MSKLPGKLNPALHRQRTIRAIDERYVRYERQKSAWIAAHPGASAAEYDVAIAQIARKCKV